MSYYTDNDFKRLDALGYDVNNTSWTQLQIIDLQTAAELVTDQFDEHWDEIIYDREQTPIISDDFKETVSKAKLFFDIVDDYLSERYSLDSEWGIDECDGVNSIDVYSDEITLQWSESDRCGDDEYYQRSFPLEHLWAPGWRSAIEAEGVKKKAEREAKRLADLERLRKQTEERERAKLRELMVKYPDEVPAK